MPCLIARKTEMWSFQNLFTETHLLNIFFPCKVFFQSGVRFLLKQRLFNDNIWAFGGITHVNGRAFLSKDSVPIHAWTHWDTILQVANFIFSLYVFSKGYSALGCALGSKVWGKALPADAAYTNVAITAGVC